VAKKRKAKKRKANTGEATTPAPGTETAAHAVSPGEVPCPPALQEANAAASPCPARPNVAVIGRPFTLIVDPRRRGTPVTSVTLRNMSPDALDLAVTVEAPGAAVPTQLHLARNGEATFRVAVTEEDATGVVRLVATVVQAGTGEVVQMVPIFLSREAPEN